MRVLLFVQTGDGRARVFRRFHPRAEFVRVNVEMVVFKLDGMVTYRRTPEMGYGLPWWLVECENAEAGRRLIAAGTDCGVRANRDVPPGRILASGGKV